MQEQSQGVAIDFEGQLIYNQTDYFKGMINMNSDKIEKCKENQFMIN